MRKMQRRETSVALDQIMGFWSHRLGRYYRFVILYEILRALWLYLIPLGALMLKPTLLNS